MFKKISIVLIATGITLTSNLVFADFNDRKEKQITKLDRKIETLQNHRNCIQDAQNTQDLRACRRKNKAAKQAEKKLKAEKKKLRKKIREERREKREK